MNVSNRDDFLLKVEINEASCLYFCSYFYKAFKDKVRINDVSILKHYSSREALCYCSSCRNKIKKYFLNYDTLSDAFFFKGRKLLIQRYPKVYCGENNLVIYMSASYYIYFCFKLQKIFIKKILEKRRRHIVTNRIQENDLIKHNKKKTFKG